MIRKRLILSVLIAAVIAIATLSLSSCDVFDSEEPEYYPDRIIFRFHDEYGNFL